MEPEQLPQLLRALDRCGLEQLSADLLMLAQEDQPRRWWSHLNLATSYLRNRGRCAPVANVSRAVAHGLLG